MAGYELFSAPLVCAREIFISFCRRQPERKKSWRQTLFTRETYIALFKTALSGFEELDRFDLIHRKRRRNLSDHSRKHRRGWQLTLAMLGESESPEICHIRARIYNLQSTYLHHPTRTRLILRTVSYIRTRFFSL